VRPWHPRWADYRPVLRRLAPFFADPDQHLLFVSDAATLFSVMPSDGAERVVRLQTSPFLQSAPERYKHLFGRFDACLLEFEERNLERTDEAVGRMAPLMKDGGRIIISIREQRPMVRAEQFGAGIADLFRQLPSSSALVEEVRYVPASRLRRMSYRIFASLGTAAHQRSWFGIPALAVLAAPLALLTFVLNLVAAVGTRTTPPRGMASSLHIVVQVHAPTLSERIANGD
jgi:hypothetical protein